MKGADLSEIKRMGQNGAKSEAKPTQKKKTTRFTPRQIRFAMLYYLPDSPTFGDAKNSALKAGFSEEYAKNITVEKERANLKWMDEIIQDITGSVPNKEGLVNEAKKVLKKSLKSKDDKLAQDTAKFLANTDDEFKKKTDLTSNGESINSPVALVEFVDGQGEDTDTD